MRKQADLLTGCLFSVKVRENEQASKHNDDVRDRYQDRSHLRKKKSSDELAAIAEHVSVAYKAPVHHVNIMQVHTSGYSGYVEPGFLKFDFLVLTLSP